jgi:hypothetical protein
MTSLLLRSYLILKSEKKYETLDVGLKSIGSFLGGGEGCHISVSCATADYSNKRISSYSGVSRKFFYFSSKNSLLFSQEAHGLSLDVHFQ